eukprot:TRINITY_DN8445_c0_g1_i1.p1 TRINITY_DN8445_c0_g1~~TRINITY_DN8445_c0_g1_i1.p1  ORF type:complete len:677 (+),score=190.98 TRINITY_DN8445_c0_g1_i1:125-2155(+)
MFKKPFRTIQGLLKGKDAKQLKRALQEQYPALRDEQLLQRLFPAKEEVTQHKIDSHLIIYTVGDLPVVFDVSGKYDLYPTVFALWQVPNLCPHFTVPAQVSKFVLNQADLMVPGLLENEFMDSLLANDKWCVVVEGNRMPFAIGLTDVSAREVRNKGKGRALKLMHVVYDALWAYGPKTTPPGFTPQEIKPIDAPPPAPAADAAEPAPVEGTTATETTSGDGSGAAVQPAHQEDGDTAEPAEPATETAEAGITEEHGGPPQATEPAEDSGSEEEDEEEDDEAGEAKPKKRRERKEVKTKKKGGGKKGGGKDAADADDTAPRQARTAEEIAEMDQRIRLSFALGCTRITQKDLPMVVSAFFAQHMNAVRPAGSAPLDFKHSSWKKISAYLKEMCALGICTTREQFGVFQLVSVNPANEQLKAWVEEAHAAKRGVRTQEQVDAEEDRLRARLAKQERSSCIQIEFFYRPAGNIKHIFPPETHQSLLTDKEACEHLVQYLQKQGLDPSVADRSLFKGRRTVVHLDPLLARELYTKKETAPQSEELINLEGRFLEKLQAWHCIQHPKGDPVIQKGQIRPIQIQTAMRMGNKTVTRILHVNEFGFDLKDLCSVLQRRFASSVSVPAPVGGGKGGQPELELLAQGDKVQEALDFLLNECKIPKKFIEVIDGKGGKKAGGHHH